MASKYPVSALLDQARRYGAPTPFELPPGHRMSDWGWPSDWVRDGATNMVMPAAKFEQLTSERRAYAAEQRAQQLASARVAIRELESERKRLTSELQSFAKELQDAVASTPDDVATILALSRSVTDRANSRGSVVSSLAGQRRLIQDLSGRASDALSEPADEAVDEAVDVES